MRARLVIQYSLLILGMGFLDSASAVGGDWPMWGRTPDRNPVVPDAEAPLEWDIETGRNIRWKSRIGSQAWSSPIVAGGQVYIGTNNQAGYLDRYPSEVDLGCLLCFDEQKGDFLWQYSAEKLPIGRVHDWPYQGIGSSPLVDGDRLWFVDNRWQVVCADVRGFRDEVNDGPFQNEDVVGPQEADIIWKFDLITELGVFPHTAGMGPDRRCSVAAYGERIYVVTGNGVAENHLEIPAPRAPSLVCLDRNTAEVLWIDNSPGARILHGQWANPLAAEIDGRAQVIVPQGDGWIRSFDALSGELIWKFDMNHKDWIWHLFGHGFSRNNVLCTPVLFDNRIYVASGQVVEHGEGAGRLVCLDPTKTGDISAALVVDAEGQPVEPRRARNLDPRAGEKTIPNPNSGLIWEFGSRTEAEYEQQEFEAAMHRAVGSVAVHQGLVIAADTTGFIRCFDARTGKQHWVYDAFANIIGSPLIVGDRVYVGDEDGDVTAFRLSSEFELFAENWMAASVYPSTVFANGTLFLTARRRLYAIAESSEANQPEPTDGIPAEAPSKELAPQALKTHTQEPYEAEVRGPARKGDIDPRRVPRAAYVPTPQDIIHKMLKLLEVRKSETLVDLGSGDGRILLTAAKQGCRVIGYELDRDLVKTARQKAERHGLGHLVTVHEKDLFEADLTEADVVVLYLIPAQTQAILPKLQRQLKPGSRVVCHRYSLPEIEPSRVARIKSSISGETHTLYLYVAPFGDAGIDD